MAIENDVKAYLDTCSLSARTFIGPVRSPAPPAIPQKAVFILGHGGFSPEAYMDSGTTSYRFQSVQIRVRGEPNSFQATQDLANIIWSSMQQPTTLTGSYTRCTCDQSLPMYLGRDAEQCDEYSVNATLEKRA